MELLDIHTHNKECDSQSSILNSNEYITGRRISMGIHPWNISSDWEKQFAIIRANACKENVCAIGECGTDKLKSPANEELQQEVFRAHATLAEEAGKPLIIHCVKGFDTIIALHKEISPKQAWIIHGFRGKPQQAEQLIKNGFYISFGDKFNIDSVKATPLERLFIESDESKKSIDKIYDEIAKVKGCSIAELCAAIMHNATKCNIPL